MSRLGRLKIGLGIAILFFLTYFSLDLFVLSLGPIGREVVSSQSDSWHSLVLQIAFVAMGFFRIALRHPALNKSYMNWLRTTPWTSDMLLPLGPVYLVWTDAVVLAGGILLAKCTTNGSPFSPLITFGIVYLLIGGFTMLITAQWPAILIAFGFGGVIRVWGDTAILLVVLVAMYGLFVLNLPAALGKCSFFGLAAKMKFRRGVLGWPFDPLRPNAAEVKAAWPPIIVGAALMGWLAYAMDYQNCLDPSNQGSAGIFVIGEGVGLGLIRTAVYLSGMASPRPIWARILTGRLIAPGYDYEFLTPITVVAAAAALARTSPSPRSGYEPIFIGVSFAILILIAFGGWPSLESWRLTGGHRIRRVRSQPGASQIRGKAGATFETAIGEHMRETAL